MRIVIIGAGNVASVLGRLIKNAGHDILQVMSRKAERAAMLGDELGCAHTHNIKLISLQADLYLVAVSDYALNEIYESFNVGEKIIVHTAGSVSKDILAKVSLNYGVLYPLQSLRLENRHLHQDIPILVDGNSPANIDMIKKLALTISSSVENATDEQRMKLHVAAVFVSNFSNHMYALAAEYCFKSGLNFKMLQPLIEETALRLRDHSPAEMQTGPAIRKDIITLDKHLRELSAYPKMRNIYLKITDSIMND